jgi:Na+-transporting methylmalonyl-CoA/oxaloacetate decarboxylase gamma subunit
MDKAAALIPTITALVTALLALIVQVGRLMGKMNDQADKIDAQADQVESVHRIVNSQRTELIDHIATLTALLKASGITVPVASPAVDDATGGSTL